MQILCIKFEEDEIFKDSDLSNRILTTIIIHSQSDAYRWFKPLLANITRICVELAITRKNQTHGESNILNEYIETTPPKMRVGWIDSKSASTEESK